MLLTSLRPDTWAVLIAMAVGTVTWQLTALVVGLLAVCSAIGLLAEWQAQRTLVTVARMAPAGLVTLHQNTSMGNAFRLVWRADSDQRRRQTRT